MIRKVCATVTDVAITLLPAAPLHALEIWSQPSVVATRLETAMGFALPPMGRSAGSDILQLIRYEPTVWLAEGNVSALPALLADDGALTAIGGGIVRLCLEGPGWRALLMASAVFDAENPKFGPGCSAATLIDHVAVRLHVTDDQRCIAYVPASYCADLLHFWQEAASTLKL
jgi:heterotetrameric sarcosine oxidase gamma subunit